MVEGTGAAGSIWNKNSWHWEEKNYTEFAKKFLSERLPKVTYDAKNPACTITLYELKSIEGTCSVTIRKQKPIYLYDFTIHLYFTAKSESEEVMGTLKLADCNQDDDEVDIEVTCEKPTVFAAGVRKILNTEIGEPCLSAIRELKDALAKIETDREKIQKDKAQRDKELSNMQKAEESKGDAK